MSLISGLTSKRQRPIDPPKPPTAFETAGGWNSPAEGYDDDSDRNARREGLRALAAARAADLERRKAIRDQRLGNAPRGRDFTGGGR